MYLLVGPCAGISGGGFSLPTTLVCPVVLEGKSQWTPSCIGTRLPWMLIARRIPCSHRARPSRPLAGARDRAPGYARCLLRHQLRSVISPTWGRPASSSRRCRHRRGDRWCHPRYFECTVSGAEGVLRYSSCRGQVGRRQVRCRRHAFGRKIAAKFLARRKNDPGFSDDGYASSVAPRHHRQDPDNPGQGLYAPFYGARSHCFAVTIRHDLDDAPQLMSSEYIQALRQARTKGIGPWLVGTLPADLVIDSPPRTPNGTSIGLFWATMG